MIEGTVKIVKVVLSDCDVPVILEYSGPGYLMGDKEKKFPIKAKGERIGKNHRILYTIQSYFNVVQGGQLKTRHILNAYDSHVFEDGLMNNVKSVEVLEIPYDPTQVIDKRAELLESDNPISLNQFMERIEEAKKDIRKIPAFVEDLGFDIVLYANDSNPMLGLRYWEMSNPATSKVFQSRLNRFTELSAKAERKIRNEKISDLREQLARLEAEAEENA